MKKLCCCCWCGDERQFVSMCEPYPHAVYCQEKPFMVSNRALNKPMFCVYFVNILIRVRGRRQIVEIMSPSVKKVSSKTYCRRKSNDYQQWHHLLNNPANAKRQKDFHSVFFFSTSFRSQATPLFFFSRRFDESTN